MAKVKIEVAKKFIHHDPHSRDTTFLPGIHEVDEEIANHWYVKHHLKDAPEVSAPVVGTPEYAKMMQEKEAERLALVAEQNAQKAAEAQAAHEKAIADAQQKAVQNIKKNARVALKKIVKADEENAEE